MAKTIKKILIAVGKEKLPQREIDLVMNCFITVKDALESYGYNTEPLYVEIEDFFDLKAFKNKILALKGDYIFNLFEGFDVDSLKEPEFAKLLEELKIPFSGNGSKALRLCLNKDRTKKILSKCDVAVPQGIMVTDAESFNLNGLRLPVFVKPCYEDASLGIDKDSLVENEKDLKRVIAKKLRRFSRGIIVEEFISGEEFIAGFIGKYPYDLVGMSVINYLSYSQFKPFLSYDAKWNTTAPVYSIEPVINKKLKRGMKKKIVASAIEAGKALNCQGYFRVDLRERDGKIYILDVNPNPDISIDSGFIKMAKAGGLSFDDVIKKIVFSTNGKK